MMRAAIDFKKVAVAVLCVGGVLASSSSASAATRAPGWEITSHSLPTVLPPGGRGVLYLDVVNVGAASTEEGRPVTVTDVLPEGLTASYAGGTHHSPQLWDCTGTKIVRCTSDFSFGPIPGGGGSPGVEPSVPDRRVAIEVQIAPGAASHLINTAAVSGGGAPSSASTTSELHISSTPAGFGIASWDVWFSNEDGTLDTQAGSHPYAATFDLNLNTVFQQEPRNNGEYETTVLPAGAELRNATVDLPPGFVGNPTAAPQCPREVFDEGANLHNNCPPDTVVGTASTFTAVVGATEQPVYNIAPPPGVAAQFGFSFDTIPTFLDSRVRTGGDYGITTEAANAPQGRGVLGAMVTLWGVPGDQSHNQWRCEGEPCSSAAGTAPLLTLPTACGAAQPFTVKINSWQNPDEIAENTVLTHDSNGDPTGFTGCERLSFGPTITTAPDTSFADTPAGLTVEVRPPLGGLTEATGLSPSDIQNTTVVLPEGVVINPGQAAGLQACSDTEAALTSVGEQAEGRENDGPAACPGASKVGTVAIKTPLLEGTPEKELLGNVYVLQSNPPEVKLLVAASADGVNLKLVGVVHLDEQTGQLTTTFSGTPELPFSSFKLSFSGGAQAALDTPLHCGTYTTSADFSPWSSPLIADFNTTADLAIAAGPGGGPCPASPLPFAPSMTAGSTTDQAGAFTNFSLLLQRGDGQQRISGLQFKAPEGLTGELSKVPLCTNAQAEANTCPEASKIGHTVVESGPGPYPLVVPEPGQEPAPIYLTESYGGAPFGLSIVVPLHVGPFVLPTQRVRAKIEINPTTTQLTITTNELPQVVAGVPTDLREIDAVIERPEFMVNPTNCNPQSFSGTATGTPPPGAGGPGATAAISSPFGVGSCRSLEFAPKLSASTSGKTSKADGASLTYKVAYPNVPQGTDADVQYVKVELPSELPSRLTTLQKACTAAQFKANPAGCPAASVIGHAVVHTQLLPVPLEGPVYFVSNGGEAFPNLVMVLQGDGVTVELVGDTLIKNGVTSTTFKTVPDDPFTTFEVNLPEGPHSALAANGNLCKPTVAKTVKKKVKVQVKGRMRTVTRKVKEQVATSLTIPSDYVGQNGATYNAKVPITVTGCAKAKPAKKKARKKKK
jgi:hypothetical protein